MQAWSNFSSNVESEIKLINCFMCKQPESFFYINIYFSNRFLIQLIMENIQNLKKKKKKRISVGEESHTTSVSSLGEIIKCN